MILVTGGSGYVGSLLCKELSSLGNIVVNVDVGWYGHSQEGQGYAMLFAEDAGRFPAQNLDTSADLDAVVHLAGLSNDPTADFAPELNNRANVQATKTLAWNVAKLAREQGRTIKFLFASSCSVYYTAAGAPATDLVSMHEGLPVAPTANYSKTKRLAEIELQKVAMAIPEFCPVFLRKGTLFGDSPRMRFDLVVNAFVLQAAQHGRLTVHGSGEAWRPLLHVRDAVDAYVHMLSAPPELVQGKVYNLLHKNYRVLELAHWVAEILQEERDVDIRVVRQRMRDEAVRSYYVDGYRITDDLGFRPERGVRGAVLEVWDSIQTGRYGDEPWNDDRYYNIRTMQKVLAEEGAA